MSLKTKISAAEAWKLLPRLLFALVSSLTLVMALGGLSGCGESASKKAATFGSMDVTGAPWGQTFSLPDLDGKTITNQSFPGKVTAVFFGFLYCPDACPTHLTKMQDLKKRLGPDGDKLQVVFITVDPERDTPELLKAYMANFDPSFVALRPTPEQLQPLLKDFKIYAKKVEGKSATSYTMDHSAQSYLYDPQGRLRLYNRYGSGAQALADDARLLLKGL